MSVISIFPAVPWHQQTCRGLTVMPTFPPLTVTITCSNIGTSVMCSYIIQNNVFLPSLTLSAITHWYSISSHQLRVDWYDTYSTFFWGSRRAHMGSSWIRLLCGRLKHYMDCSIIRVLCGKIQAHIYSMRCQSRYIMLYTMLYQLNNTSMIAMY